ncbi:MAG: hypothetical protein AAGA62_05680, partial [Bacteroidota bacterium]
LPAGIAGTYYSQELNLLLRLSLIDEELWLESSKHGKEKLTQTEDLSFTSSNGLFAKLRLQKDDEGDIKSLWMDLGERTMNLKFEKKLL